MIVAKISHDPHYRHALILCGDGRFGGEGREEGREQEGVRGKEGELGEIPSN